MTVDDQKYAKGLHDLTLSVVHDLEPHDPPKGMKERIFEKIESCETSESADNKGVPIVKKFLKPWFITAAVICALVSTCYAYTAKVDGKYTWSKPKSKYRYKKRYWGRG